MERNRRDYCRSGSLGLKNSSGVESEALRLLAGFETDMKKHGVIFAAIQIFQDNFRKNGFLRGLGVLALIFWRNLVVQPFEKLREELRKENSKRLNIDGFQNVRKHRPDYMIPLLAGLLMIIGLVLMYSLSPQWAKFQNQSYGHEFGEYHFFNRQILMYGVGILAFGFFARTSLGFFYKHSGKFLAVGIAACLILFGLGFMEIISKQNIPLAKCEKGACRWLEAGISIQPAELIKFGVLIALSVFLGIKIKEKRVNNWKESILPSVFLVAVMVALIAFPPQKDLGTAMSALAIVAFQFFVAGINKRNISIFGVLALIGVVGFIVMAPHRLERISTFSKQEDCSNLESSEKREEYQICRAKIAAGSGGLLGLGIGRSVSTAGYLPEMINDSIFAAMGEIVGFVGLLAVLAIYLGLIYRILRISNFMENPATRILSAGIAGWFAVHTLMNIAAIIGIIPLTGITIPLISYGGTSIVVISSILGLAFNASGYTTFSKKIYKEAEDENLGSRRRVRRSRDSRRGSF
ncbi:MAG: FtsW/RodA/SpoVE family cell cycle protein [bacterium]|nr:FtsW/RodA/SpoVE family cell cycle protein [bacterium]